MSRHHSTIASEIHYILNEVRELDNDEIERLHGINILEDGTIQDPMFGMTFTDLAAWATFSVEQDHEEQFESIDEFEGWS